MNSYFVTSEFAQTEDVTSAIEYVHGNVPGYIMDDTSLTHFCTRRNVRVVSLSNTDVDGLVIPVFEPVPDVDTPVEAGDTGTSGIDPAAQVGLVLSADVPSCIKAIGRDIVFHRPDDGYYAASYYPINDGKFHIWLSGCVAGHGFVPYTERNRAYFEAGTPIGHSVYMYIPTGRNSHDFESFMPYGDGVKISMRANGKNLTVAELYKNNLFIHIPMHTGQSVVVGYHEYRIVEHICSKVMDHPFDEEDRIAFNDANKRLFLEFTDSTLADRRQRCTNAINEAESNINQHRDGLRNAYDSLQYNRNLMQSLDGMNQKFQEKVLFDDGFAVRGKPIISVENPRDHGKHKSHPLY